MHVDGCEGGGVEGDDGDGGGKGGGRNGGGNGSSGGSGGEGDGGEGGGQDCFGRAAVPTGWWSAVEARAARRSAVARAAETAAAETAAARVVARSKAAREPCSKVHRAIRLRSNGCCNQNERGRECFPTLDPKEARFAGGALFSLLVEVLGKCG